MLELNKKNGHIKKTNLKKKVRLKKKRSYDGLIRIFLWVGWRRKMGAEKWTSHTQKKQKMGHR